MSGLHYVNLMEFRLCATIKKKKSGRIEQLMPNKRVTMQDIADACGLSRNTVSKVFNGRGAVPLATRETIRKKAEELGYGSPAENIPSAPRQAGGSIALLTGKLPRDAHFGTSFIPTFSDQITRSGYSLKNYEISPEELNENRLPPHFDPKQIAGIVGIELFSGDYLHMICGLGVPTVMTDSPVEAANALMECDFVTMENTAGIIALVKRLAASGAKKMGFVGDSRHCGSFMERWTGFTQGLNACGLRPDEALCICRPDDSPYDDPDWLISNIKKMPALPDAFVCANDYLAIHLMGALKKMGLSIPGDVMVTGFDGTPQSAFVEPPLTTVEIPGVNVARVAAKVLLNRIADPGYPFVWIRVKTTPVWRGSSR